MANLISSGFTDFPTTYTGAASKFLRVSSNISLGTVFSGAELSDLDKVETSGAYAPANGQALIYNSAADRWRPSTLDVYSAGNGVNKSGLTLNVVAGIGGGLESNANGVFITNIANVAGTYGNSTLVPSITVNDKGQVTAVTVSQANAQYAYGLTANYVGSVSGTSGQIVVTGGTGNNSNAVIDLVATGITAGWYGNVRPNGQIVIPTVDVDSYGRVRQIVEVPIAFDGNGNVIPSANITSYSVFRVDGQTSIIADQPEDTVSFIAGPGIEITTNAANDSITWAANTTSLFNNTSISAFSDVGSLVGIQGGQILIWSNITGKFEYGNTSSSSSGTIISSDLTPSGVPNDSLWYDEISGRLYILYDGAWVDASPGATTSAFTNFTTLTGATGTVVHDCASTYMFAHNNTVSNFTANLTNLTVPEGSSITVKLVIDQWASAYMVNAVQIGGVAQTVLWQGSSTPTGTAFKTDLITLEIMRTGANTHMVLGQLASYGEPV